MPDLKMPFIAVREFADGRQQVFGDSRLTVDQLVELFEELPTDGCEVVFDGIMSLRGFDT